MGSQRRGHSGTRRARHAGGPTAPAGAKSTQAACQLLLLAAAAAAVGIQQRALLLGQCAAAALRPLPLERRVAPHVLRRWGQQEGRRWGCCGGGGSEGAAAAAMPRSPASKHGAGTKAHKPRHTRSAGRRPAGTHLRVHLCLLHKLLQALLALLLPSATAAATAAAAAATAAGLGLGWRAGQRRKGVCSGRRRCGSGQRCGRCRRWRGHWPRCCRPPAGRLGAAWP